MAGHLPSSWVFVNVGRGDQEVMFPVPVPSDVDAPVAGPPTPGGFQLSEWLATAVPAAHAVYCKHQPRLNTTRITRVTTPVRASDRIRPLCHVWLEEQGGAGMLHLCLPTSLAPPARTIALPNPAASSVC